MQVASFLFISAYCLATTSFLAAAAAAGPSTSAPRAPEGARPQTTLEAARALGYQGQEHYEAGRYAHAVEAARAAQRLVSAPTLALLEARSLKKLGHYLAARTQYGVAAGPLPPNSSEAFHLARQAAVGELLILEDELPRLALELRSPRESGSAPVVTVDGVHWKATSIGIWVAQDPGDHVVEVTFDGATERHLLRLAPRDKQRLLLGAPDNDRGASTLRIPLAISGFALGALGLGVGIGFGVHAGNLRDQLDAGCPEDVCSPALGSTLDDYRTSRDASTVGYVVAATGALAGGIVLVALPSAKATETGAGLLTLHAGQIDLSGSF